MTRGMRCSSRVRPARPGERATIESTFHFAIVPFRHARIPSAPRALRLTSSDVRPLFPAATRAETFVRKMEAAQTKLWRAVRREVSRASRVGPSDSSAASVSSGDDAGLSPEFVAAAHALEILRECAWPSVCEPVSATRCFMPAHWHSLKNGMVVTMSSTLWLCGAGRTKVRSAL